MRVLRRITASLGVLPLDGMLPGFAGQKGRDEKRWCMVRVCHETHSKVYTAKGALFLVMRENLQYKMGNIPSESAARVFQSIFPYFPS